MFSVTSCEARKRKPYCNTRFRLIFPKNRGVSPPNLVGLKTAAKKRKTSLESALFLAPQIFRAQQPDFPRKYGHLALKFRELGNRGDKAYINWFFGLFASFTAPLCLAPSFHFAPRVTHPLLPFFPPFLPTFFSLKLRSR